MSNHPTLIEFFCGAGGLALGFQQAGFVTLAAFDNDPSCIATYNRNLGEVGHVADITGLTRAEIERIIGQNVSVDVIAGGPPCQGFSVQRRGLDDDPRNLLVLEYMRLVFDFMPRFFVMENVGGLLSPRGAPFLSEVMEKSKQAGYAVHIQKLKAVEYGVPQDRRRVFIIGELTEHRGSKFVFPPARPEYTQDPATVRSAIFDLMSRSEQEIPNHRADSLSEINLLRIRSITEGQGRDSLPLDLQLDCHRENAGHRHLDTYGRMAWDKPSPTITARFDSFSRGRFGHPVLDRTITLREGARLQTFPDSFTFVGTKVSVAKQIGNAVPPLLARQVASSIKECLERDDV
jgi:DNA (cytosine-5)-methyltransferase 1